MPFSWSPEDHPFLTEDTCEITSPPSRQYNCIAWAAKDSTRNWWPDPWRVGYWPLGVPRRVTVEAFMEAFARQGYKLCLNASLEPTLEKIAIFGKETSDGTVIPTHAALQLESGEWTSKLGALEDVRHKKLESVNGPAYGKPVCLMARPRNIK